MKEIITDLTKLETPAEPLIFVTETGITKDEGEQIISEIKEVMKNKQEILALSAPQIGINKRIFCIRFGDKIKTFINPIITKKTDIEISAETFSSMPGKEILIARPKEISVIYHTDEFKYEDNKLLGAAAKIFDQQVQLLDGVLPSELGLVSDIEADGKISDLTEEELLEAAEIYKKFITAKTTELTKHFSNSETFKQLKFTEDVINGRTQVIENEPERKLNREQRRAAAKQAKKIAAKYKGR